MPHRSIIDAVFPSSCTLEAYLGQLNAQAQIVALPGDEPEYLHLLRHTLVGVRQPWTKPVHFTPNEYYSQEEVSETEITAAARV